MTLFNKGDLNICALLLDGNKISSNRNHPIPTAYPNQHHRSTDSHFLVKHFCGSR